MAIVVNDFFSEAGPVAKRLEGFELREEQRAMAAAVAGAFENGRHLMVEAGTGVGKSFAYLVPAIAQAAAGKKVVISTHTISLQEQLMEKDIPFLRAVSGQEFSAVLCKGRSNYLCMRRLEQASKKGLTLFADSRGMDDLVMIEDWANTTKDGSLSDMPRQPAWQVWDKVCAERGNCLGRRCKYYEGCFYQASRRRIANGQILICNHALFFSDLALKQAGGGGMLPAYDFVVLDEGHTVEAVASDHFGISVSESQVRYLLQSLFSSKTHRGFLATLDDLDTLAAAEAVQAAEEGANRFFEGLDRWLEKGPANGRVREKGIVSDPLSPALEGLVKSLRGLADQLGARLKKKDGEAGGGIGGGAVRAVVDDPEEGVKLKGKEYEIEKLRYETSSYMERVAGVAGALRVLLGQEMEEAVYWVESTGKTSRRLKWTCSPINVAEQLREHLFGKIPSVVLTSATLSTKNMKAGNWEPKIAGGGTGGGRGARSGGAGGAFDYLKSRVGFEAGGELQLGSPFDYRKQCTLYLETGLPLPDEQGFLGAAMDRAMHYIRQTQGRAFVLFTSYAMLDKAAKILGPELGALGYTLLSQGGTLTRGQLLTRFKNSPNAVLLGTDSFWQGVDVRGEALSNVIIVKLPFEVPDKPLVGARLDAIRLAGGNAFGEYSLPEAIIKFKQGFGRLIRSKTDTGIVVVLDKRIVIKGYGRQFLDALPECRVVRVEV